MVVIELFRSEIKRGRGTAFAEALEGNSTLERLSLVDTKIEEA